MILKSYCKFCRKEISVNGTARDRAELSFKKGKAIKVTCDKCFKAAPYHPNEIFAVRSKTGMVTGVLVLILSIVLILVLIGNYYLDHREYIENNSFRAFARLMFLPVIPILVYQLITDRENNKIRIFNSFKIKKKE
ncbi:MAG: hypothetical protein KDC56_08425 [Flavobacteriaceae bacterium]|nr:hypothetical protein [Flavobacteriaceae bacterium]